MKNIKKNLIIIILIIIIFVLYLLNNNYGKKYFNNDMTVNYSISNILIEQEEINAEISKISQSKEYAIDNPKVILNPYKISPLTALIIFNTPNDCEVNVDINDEYSFKMEKSKEHIIPIYGMYENKENIISLEINGEEKTLSIKTDRAENINPLIINKLKFNNYNDLYFMTSPVGTSASAYDQQGNLKWYLTERFTMDFEWLSNGHFLVGIPESSVADRKIGFVEMDYLGKIYNYYTLEHGYEFEFQILDNGNYMLAGGDKPVFYDKAWIYEMNPKTGEMVNHIDLYQIFKDIDLDFDSTRLNFRIIRNAFYYNEENGEILVSLRGLNSVVSIDYNTKKINYIFAPEGIYSDKFDKYMVSLESGRYPLGQHSVFITKEGYVGFINNGYDRYNGFEVGGIDKVSHYKKDYSSAEIYEIKDKKAKQVWKYDANKKYFTHQYGSFSIYGENKLINFGWTLNDDYRKKKDATLSESEKNTDNTYAKIIEINEKDEIVLDAKIEDGKYRVFKNNLYFSEMKNFNYNKSTVYNTIPKSNIEVIKTKEIEDNLNSAQAFDNKITYTKYSIDTTYSFDTYDEVDILLVGENNQSYKVDYKEENKNINKLLNIDLKEGEYALYLIINNIYFKTNTKVIY